ncbi:MAG: NAD(P)-dependent alcohol dehydrogenase [Deltaproteobacteria bacterium]|nr:NAD(P)-dependent alcohol dehydrogenase [Deltaproteobacteria bacterium]
MQALALCHAFGLDHLQLVDRPDPQPLPHQVVVRVRAASLNYRDLLMVTGAYNPRQPLPLVPLSDGAGEIVAVGSAVRDLAVGDRVIGHFCQAWRDGVQPADAARHALGGPLDGALQQLWCLDAAGVARFPDHLDFVQAATLPCAALTAWTALFEHGNLRPGQTVLVQGTGGVSVFATQLARLAGATVFATSGSDAKLDRMRALGAAHTLNYRATPEWGKAVADLGGADHVVEVGGAGTLGQSLRAVKVGGHIALIGVLAGGKGEVNLMPALMNSVRIEGVFVGSHAAMARMLRAIAAGKLVPVVDRARPWRDAAQALRSMQAGEHFGKIALEFDA